MELGDAPTALVLDFFAGSGTTAQAVLELNAKDGGHRKFILVQLPEKTDNPKFPTIADITRERVRRVVARLAEADEAKSLIPAQSTIPLTPSEPSTGSGRTADLGFRAFKLAASNFKVWDSAAAADAAALTEQIALHADHLIGPLGTTAAQGAILYELILRAGSPVSARVKRVSTPHGEAFSVNDNELLVCVEERVTQPLIRALIALKPTRLVCLDKSFAGDDALKTNTVLEAETHNVKFQTA